MRVTRHLSLSLVRDCCDSDSRRRVGGRLRLKCDARTDVLTVILAFVDCLSVCIA